MNRNRRASLPRVELLTARSGAVLGVLLAVMVLPPIALSDSNLSIAQSCGASDQNVPSEIVNLSAAKDIWLEFPAMMRAPMLETNNAATLVVFPANYDLSAVTVAQPGMAPSKSVGVVLCVVDQTGYVALFTNVDPSGSRIAH